MGIPHVLGGANHIHEFLAPVIGGGGAEPAKVHAGYHAPFPGLGVER